jgi:hypothetical protein
MKVAGKNGSSLEEIYQGQEEKWIGSKMKLARAYGWVVSSLVRSLKKSTCSRTLPISPKSSSCTQSNPTLGWSPCDFCSTCCSTWKVVLFSDLLLSSLKSLSFERLYFFHSIKNNPFSIPITPFMYFPDTTYIVLHNSLLLLFISTTIIWAL